MRKILEQITQLADQPGFFLRVYELVCEKRKKDSSLVTSIFDQDVALSLELKDSSLQESSRIRNVIKTRAIAIRLITDSGAVHEEFLKEMIAYLREKRFLLGPKSIHEAPMEEHLFKSLQFLQESKEVNFSLKMISKPLSFPYVEQLVRDTLDLDLKHVVTDADVKRAVLSAWLCYFRQNVGSCFATAPAIVIHDEQPIRFLHDCRDLFSTGRLKRTFGGIEYSVPLSPSFGSGSLRKPVYLAPKGKELLGVKGLFIVLKSLQIKKKSEKLIEEAFSAYRGGIITVEEILKILLLYHYELQEDEIREIEDKPVDLLQQKLLAETKVKISTKKSKAQIIRGFHESFSRAKVIYKAVTDNPILRTWEFTVASFSESKADFCTWNIYSSLGMHSSEPQGIGECIYNFLSKKLEEYKKEIDEIQIHYEQVFYQAKTLESQLKRASSESQEQWARIEYNSCLRQIDELLNKRDAFSEKTNSINQFYQFLMKTYEQKFPEYFQEIYDADMREEAESFYDDSPAGFRLLFKHGRNNPSVWSMIYTPKQFINYLVEFFILTENEIMHSEGIDDLKKEYSDLVGEITRHIKTDEFLESAFYRVAKVHKVVPQSKPLENLDKISKKPWAYTSGGSMATLISCLYSRESPPTEKSTWVESEEELLAFYVDSLKEVPHSIIKAFMNDAKRSMLAFSPTHAFTLKPGLEPFVLSWMEQSYTYTWVRDHFIVPRKDFVQKIYVSEMILEAFSNVLSKNLPEEIALLLKRSIKSISGNMTLPEFRSSLIQRLSQENWVKRIGKVPLSLEDIDGSLYEHFPYISSDLLANRVIDILKHVLGDHSLLKGDISLLSEYLSTNVSKYSVISSSELREITEACLLLCKKDVSFVLDYHNEIVVAMQSLGFSMPRPILFADSNWVNTRFGFVINPGTLELEFWALDYVGSTGHPLMSWKKWFKGFGKKTWGLYVKPFEYGQE
ncbi:MAG: hypothetical protein P4L16_03165 [Chlamydiales bacterium]|nr:hypothetical protein [Chlamydiales bacterium]